MIPRPRVRIHVWGGLGSQLNAVLLTKRLSRQYPKYSFLIVLHTGGITYRSDETSALFPECNFSVVDDFEELALDSSSKHVEKLENIYKRVLKLVLVKFYFVIDDKTLEKRNFLFPWTVSIRGHYSHLRLQKNEILEILQCLEFKALTHDIPIKSVAIHYRLGDLMVAGKNNVVKLCDIEGLVFSLDFPHQTQIYFFTDSLDDLSSQISSSPLKEKFFVSVESISARELIVIGSQVDVFVGTSSKLSLWIALIRATKGKSPTFLPLSLEASWSKLIPLDSHSSVSFY